MNLCGEDKKWAAPTPNLTIVKYQTNFSDKYRKQIKRKSNFDNFFCHISVTNIRQRNSFQTKKYFRHPDLFLFLSSLNCPYGRYLKLCCLSVEYLFVPYPPPNLRQNSPLVDGRFWDQHFCFFFEKNVIFLKFTLLHHVFSKLFKKSIYHLKSHFMSFFNKNQGSTLSFFSDFDQNSWFLNLPYYIMFYQNCSKSQFYHMKSHFVSFFNKNQDFFFFRFWSKFISHY